MRRILGIFLLLLVWGVNLAWAETVTTVDELEVAVEALDDRFEILRLSDGFLLRPIEDEPFEALELRVDGWAADGQAIDDERLLELLGEDAEPFRSLLGWESEPEALADGEELAEERDIREEGQRERDRREEDRRGRKEKLQGRTVFFDSARVGENESVSEVVVIFGSLEIDGEVRGDAVVVGGSAEVRGSIEGDLTVVGGSIDLRQSARVYGDVVSVGGEIDSTSRSQIFGERTEVAIGSLGWVGDWGPRRWDRGLDLDFVGWGPFSLDNALEKAVSTVLLCLVILLLYWVARDYVNSVGQRAEREPWKAGLVGLLFQIFFLPALLFVLLILIVSLIGIPLAILLIPVSFFTVLILLFIGYAAIAQLAGRFLERRFGLQSVGPFLAVLLGIFLIQSWSILGEALLFVPGPVKISAFLLLFIGGLIKYLSWTVGLGAVLLRQFSPLPEGGSWAPPPASASWDLTPNDQPTRGEDVSPPDLPKGV